MEQQCELLVDWTVTRTPHDPLPNPDPEPGVTCFPPDEYKICEVGHIEFNVTAPGVTVANPMWELDASKCDCIEPEFDPDSNFSGTGIDRFYLGYTGLGILKLLTCGGFAIWAIIDSILIGMGKMRDAEGNSLAYDEM